MSSLDCAGAQCNLGPNFSTSAPTSVSHDIRVERGSYTSLQGVLLGGNVNCFFCLGLDVVDSTVDGNVRSQAQTLGATIYANTIHGDVWFADNQAFLETFDNTVDGNFQIMRNVGLVGLFSNHVGANILLIQNHASEIDIFGNDVRNNIVCTQDSPPIGTGNVARRIDPDCGPIGVASTG
jgi:hypothetical protein